MDRDDNMTNIREGIGRSKNIGFLKVRKNGALSVFEP